MHRLLETNDLSVGYRGRTLIRDISLSLQEGQILTLVGPNGAGKSTILRTLSRQLRQIRGSVYLQERDLTKLSAGELARQMAVMLTDRISPELMTCRELVAMGRYPFTNAAGRLSQTDREHIDRALSAVNAEELAEREYNTLSDGQKQRILLARAICQDPAVLVLDEPTAYLDIRYRLELLSLLRTLAAERRCTIILSLHEPDLAYKFSDLVMCVKGDTIEQYGTPEEVLGGDAVEKLYDMTNGSYNALLGSAELAKPEGKPEVFVIGGGGFGIPFYRALQRRGIPFSAGILFENDLDYPVASALAAAVHTAQAFEPVCRELFEQAKEEMLAVGTVLDAGCPAGSFNRCNEELLETAREKGLTVVKSPEELTGIC
ncbi:MAG: ABC transporter ATP-binding protein [Lachnospiraceae bacterium]|nr:ABC transporter ATP-binding protein [Lachnospiraceae bacterium]